MKQEERQIRRACASENIRWIEKGMHERKLKEKNNGKESKAKNENPGAVITKKQR